MTDKNVLQIYISHNDKLSKEYSLYEITTVTNMEVFKKNYAITHRRYSQFLKLHNKLKKKIEILPEFPGKALFKNKNVVNKRESLFNVYFKYLAQCMIEAMDEWNVEVIKFLTEDDY